MSKEERRSFADALKAELEVANQSQAAFAKEAGIPQPTISAYITGRREPLLDMLERMCAIFPALVAWTVERISPRPKA